jgi:hypothetical protein
MAHEVADHILSRLRQWNIRHVFAYPGDRLGNALGCDQFHRRGEILWGRQRLAEPAGQLLIGPQTVGRARPRSTS